MATHHHYHHRHLISTIIFLLACPLTAGGIIPGDAFVSAPRGDGGGKSRRARASSLAAEHGRSVPQKSAMGMAPPPRSTPHHSHRHRRSNVAALFSSTTAEGGGGGGGRRGSGRGSARRGEYDVLYQKVIRAPAGSTSSRTAFLLDLVAYLQCVFRLPDDLPMPYEIIVPSDDGEYDDGTSESDDGGRAVLIIDSPLSRDPYGARLEVEVIGIFPENGGEDEARAVGPTMAMVALKKRRNPIDDDTGGGGGVVARGLFAAIAYGNTIRGASTASSDKTRRGSGGKAESTTFSVERDALGNVIIDSATTTPAPTTTSPKKTRQNDEGMDGKRSTKGVKDMKVGTTGGNKIVPSSTAPRKREKREQNGSGDEDYAIRKARQRAEALMTTVRAGRTTSRTLGTVAISGGEGDFAILAAKRAAVANRLKGEEAPKENIPGNVRDEERENASKVSADFQKERDVQDLSSDATFLQLRTIADAAKESSWKRTISRMKKGVDAKSSSRSDRTGSQEVVSVSMLPDPNLDKTDDEIRDDVMQIARGNERVQRELRAASDMMQADSGDDEDLSPEELLRRVLKFGDEKDDEQKSGFGFVDKAKELIKTDDKQYASSSNLDLEDRGSSDEDKRKEEEAELRRIFAMGESLAENKLSQAISSPSPANLVMPSISMDDINELINADETVPRNARTLDYELAELEVRLSRSLGEGANGPSKNKVFDVFSGPEIYNPNVDPETAVNWPGAKGGTRTDVQLAADLSTALKQAQFASAVLSRMREEIDEENDGQIRYFVGSKELPLDRVDLLRKCVNEAVNAGLIEDPELLSIERSRLQLLIDELLSQPEERLEEIALNYKDLLLSENLVDHMKVRLYALSQRDLNARRMGNEDSLKEAHDRERAIMVNLAQIAQALVKEAQALGAELEVSMLEIVRSICEVAMDPRHKSEEETAVALTDAVRDMRPLLDDAFVAYLKYAIAEEEGKLARAGVLDDPEHNRWLFVLKIVQEGVYRELSRGIKRYIDHIWYVLRMKSKSERKELLKKLIDVMPTMDVRPFVKVVNNIVSSLGTTVKGDFTDGIILGEMTNQLLQLQKDTNEFLPPDRINELSKGADAWAAAQRQKLLERRNLTRQRLEAARQTGDIDPDVVIKKPGVEAERFD
ncbi:hypothetical protein ACHAW5_000991 [Stephanodiscus triporus]|uniref:Uncharacterized protein n=1 Tax=Stephanodiscus triporus TaxID=2934178 RepID=A0ABD3NAL0_9STRA